jgi:hypothetical protein
LSIEAAVGLIMSAQFSKLLILLVELRIGPL